MTPKFFLISAIVALFGAVAIPAFGQSREEMRDASGALLPQYEAVVEQTGALKDWEKKAFRRDSRQAFEKDNALFHMPRVWLRSHYRELIEKGVAQRGRALHAFLKDHHSGRQTYRSFLPVEVVHRIQARTNELGWNGKIDPRIIAFPYGPDIMNGHVIEDNPGFIGGPGDLRLARKFMLSRFPGLASAYSRMQDPDDFYKKLTDSYRSRAIGFGGKVVFVMSPYESDQEDYRIQRLMKDYGIESVDPILEQDLQLKVTEDGVYTYSKQKGFRASAEKVGFVILNGEHAWFDPTHPVARRRLVMEEVKELVSDKKTKFALKRELSRALDKPDSSERLEELYQIIKRAQPDNAVVTAMNDTRPYHGLLDAILKRQVGANYSPGVDFIGDKELYLYVPEMIRHYLGEEPVLKNIETFRFTDKDGKLDRAKLDHVLANMKDFVVKRVDGRGGQDVFVGPKVKTEAIPGIREKVVGEHPAFIGQTFLPPVEMNGMIFDTRAISDISSFGAVVANTPWGRIIAKSADGKVNIAAGGGVLTTLVVEDKPPEAPKSARCKAAL